MKKQQEKDLLVSGGLNSEAVTDWLNACPSATSDFGSDKKYFGKFWSASENLRAQLPTKPKRLDAQQQAVEVILKSERAARELFLKAHAQELYNALTDNLNQFIRLEELIYQVAELVPGLCPTREEVAMEADLMQSEKDGREVEQGIFLAHVLALPRAGQHLCHAMMLPLPQSAKALEKFISDGVLDLGPARLERRGKAVYLIESNPRFLNAEDNDTLELMEVAVDVAILDPGSEILVMRGGIVENPKYAGQHIFGAGINLTQLYMGNIPYEWFMRRDLGYLNKLYRGVASKEAVPDDVNGSAHEKPYVAVVDNFAIGGHCQLLLIADYVLAGQKAFMTLPARKEGFIPGFANLRLPRFVGDRIARQAIQYEKRLECDSDAGRLICDELVPEEEMEAAIDSVIEGLTSAGAVSVIGNRRAFRVGQEPFDIFRSYASVYAREQAYCHYSPALIANLERNWDARNRKV